MVFSVLRTWCFRFLVLGVWCFRKLGRWWLWARCLVFCARCFRCLVDGVWSSTSTDWERLVNATGGYIKLDTTPRVCYRLRHGWQCIKLYFALSWICQVWKCLKHYQCVRSVSTTSRTTNWFNFNNSLYRMYSDYMITYKPTIISNRRLIPYQNIKCIFFITFCLWWIFSNRLPVEGGVVNTTSYHTHGSHM